MGGGGSLKMRLQYSPFLYPLTVSGTKTKIYGRGGGVRHGIFRTNQILKRNLILK